MKNIKWKYNSKLNSYEGTIKGDIEPLIFIEGSLCVTDIRPCREEEWGEPKHYKIIGLNLKEAKELAEDLITGNNFEIHEQNRLAIIEEEKRTVNLLKEADELLKSLGLE